MVQKNRLHREKKRKNLPAIVRMLSDTPMSPLLTIASTPLKCCIPKHPILKKIRIFFTTRRADAVSRRWIHHVFTTDYRQSPPQTSHSKSIFSKKIAIPHLGARGLRFEPHSVGRFSEVSDFRMIFRRCSSKTVQHALSCEILRDLPKTHIELKTENPNAQECVCARSNAENRESHGLYASAQFFHKIRPHLPYHRVGPIFGTFTLKKRGKKRRPRSPFRLHLP